MCRAGGYQETTLQWNRNAGDSGRVYNILATSHTCKQYVNTEHTPPFYCRNVKYTRLHFKYHYSVTTYVEPFPYRCSLISAQLTLVSSVRSGLRQSAFAPGPHLHHPRSTLVEPVVSQPSRSRIQRRPEPLHINQ